MTTDSPASRGTAEAAVWTPPRLGVLLVHTLLLQIVIGVANAIWLDVPDSGNAWSSSSPNWLVTVHMVIGLIILVAAVWLVVQAGRERDTVWTAIGLVGLVGIVAGFAGGILFMSSNGNDVSSFAMTIGCVVAVGAYATGLARRPAA